MPPSEHLLGTYWVAWPVSGTVADSGEGLSTRADTRREQGLAAVTVVTVSCPRWSDPSAQGGDGFLQQGHPQ